MDQFEQAAKANEELRKELTMNPPIQLSNGKWKCGCSCEHDTRREGAIHRLGKLILIDRVMYLQREYAKVDVNKLKDPQAAMQAMFIAQEMTDVDGMFRMATNLATFILDNSLQFEEYMAVAARDMGETFTPKKEVG